MREQLLSGVHYLKAVTTLLQRIRKMHPTAGLYEAADLQWWWRTPRTTDNIPQLFWFDPEDHPVAAVIATDWGQRISLDPMLLPGAPSEQIKHVMERGLAHAAQHGFHHIGLEVDPANEALREVLIRHGFSAEAGFVEAWLEADARPEISTLHEGYRLLNRIDAASSPYHMIKRGHPEMELRLRQTSLYRPEFDLAVYDNQDQSAAYGLFWYNPETSTGLVEPMRTEDAHQRRGLARHILTAGVDLLARAGARRIKICYEPDNPASRTLYLNVGFQPLRQTLVFSRQSNA
jgi:RimJ/RimL family protein N-acetyltransferase